MPRGGPKNKSINTTLKKKGGGNNRKINEMDPAGKCSLPSLADRLFWNMVQRFGAGLLD